MQLSMQIGLVNLWNVFLLYLPVANLSFMCFSGELAIH